MMEDDDPAGLEASRACASCKKSKRRCDKKLPSCSLCLKTGRSCDYSESPPDGPDGYANELNHLRGRVRELEEHVLRLSSQTTTPTNYQHVASRPVPLPQLYVQASYLDSDFWSTCDLKVQANDGLAPREIAAMLGSRSDIDTVKTRYFQSAHTWMPVISKLRLDRLTDRMGGTIRANVALLLLCMKLLEEVPQEHQSGLSPLYLTAKQFLGDLQLRGLLDTRILQAGLLLSVYELGHAIYPAAFMTISYCARGGIALGLHNKSAPQMAGRPRSWTDWEERLRVWWMIVILDRYVTIGTDCRPLCTEDPNKDTLLPSDDDAWDNGEIAPPERVSLSSQQTAVSHFARLAQAANLLGRVIRHCNDTSLELQFVLDDYETLSRTIFSLTELLPSDHSATPVESCIATPICFSALFKLYNHHSCGAFDEQPAEATPRVRQCMQHCLDMLKEVCRRVVSFVRSLTQGLTHATMERASPLMLDCIYNCAAVVSWLALETNNAEYTEWKHVCEEALRPMSLRWKAAGTYLEMLRISDLADEDGS